MSTKCVHCVETREPHRVGDKPHEGSGATTSTKCVGSLVAWGIQDILSKVKDKLWHSSPPTTKKYNSRSISFWFWIQHSPPLEILF